MGGRRGGERGVKGGEGFGMGREGEGRRGGEGKGSVLWVGKMGVRGVRGKGKRRGGCTVEGGVRSSGKRGGNWKRGGGENKEDG